MAERISRRIAARLVDTVVALCVAVLLAVLLAVPLTGLTTGATSRSEGASGLTGAGTARSVSLQGGPIAVVATSQSGNWSGYDQGFLSTGKLFSQVAGEWRVPVATQAVAGQAEASATWVGVGGGCLDTSCTLSDPTTLIQAGTAQDVNAAGTASYYAWFETLPEPQARVTAFSVNPGDLVSVNIVESLPAVWDVFVWDHTTGAKATIPLLYPADMLTAEWIEESPLLISPTGQSGESPLPNLGTVGFTWAGANDQPAGLQADQSIYLINGAGRVVAYPSAPSGGAAFNVCVDPHGFAASPKCPAP